MRRKDREVTDHAIIVDIIEGCDCCRIGFNDAGEVYIVPLNFGYQEVGGKLTFYFHGAHAGRKIDLIESFPYVGFEMDTSYKVNEADIACGYSASFQSIIGNGKVSIVNDTKEKNDGLQLLMKHTTGKSDWSFEDKMIDSVSVFKLEVEKLSCKVHE